MLAPPPQSANATTDTTARVRRKKVINSYITFIDPHVHEECQGLNKTNMYHRSVLVFQNEMSVKSTKLTTIRYQLFLTVLFSVFIVSFSVTYISTMVVSFTQRHIIFDGSLLHTETHNLRWQSPSHRDTYFSNKCLKLFSKKV